MATIRRKINLNQSSGVRARLGQRQQAPVGTRSANSASSRLFAAAIQQPVKPALSKFDVRRKLSGQNSSNILDARQKLLQKTKFADARERIEKKKVQVHRESASDMRTKILEKRRLGLDTGPSISTGAVGKQSAAGQQLVKTTPMLVTVSSQGRKASTLTGDTSATGNKTVVSKPITLSRLKPPPALSGTLHSDKLLITTHNDQTSIVKAAAGLSSGSKVNSAAGNGVDPYVVRITNDLYRPPQPVETVVTNRIGLMQRTVGAAEAAAAKAAASAISAAATSVGPSARGGVLNKVSAPSTVGLVGLHQKVQVTSSLSSTGTAASPLQGFQTLVSNLHADVTLDDVMELFGDVGPLKNARLVKPGVADVIFVNMEDALAAVKTYNMRLLDGQPMSVELKFEPAADQSTSMRSKPVLDLDVAVVRRALFKTITDVERRTPVNFTVQV